MEVQDGAALTGGRRADCRGYRGPCMAQKGPDDPLTTGLPAFCRSAPLRKRLAQKALAYAGALEGGVPEPYVRWPPPWENRTQAFRLGCHTRLAPCPPLAGPRPVNGVADREYPAHRPTDRRCPVARLRQSQGKPPANRRQTLGPLVTHGGSGTVGPSVNPEAFPPSSPSSLKARPRPGALSPITMTRETRVRGVLRTG